MDGYRSIPGWKLRGHALLGRLGQYFIGARVVNEIWYTIDKYSSVGHAVLDLVGLVWDGADLINAVWYAAEGNTEMAIASAVYALPEIGMAGAGIGNIYNSLKNGEKISFKDILLAAGGTAIAIFSGKTMFSDMRQMLDISNKVDRTIKVGNADISHEPVPSEKKILETAESGRAAKSGNVGGAV